MRVVVVESLVGLVIVNMYFVVKEISMVDICGLKKVFFCRDCGL